MPVLTPLADYFYEKAWRRHLLFAVLTFIAVAINGYHLGTFDQVFHLPFLKEWNDPTLYPTDPFVGLKDYHFSYFWFMFLPAYRAGILEPVLFVVHMLVTYATFWGFWELCDQLFHNRLANLLITFALVIPHLGFPGFQIIEFSLLNRTFTIPLLLFAIVFYLRGRYGISFLLLAITFNINLVYAAFVIAMFGVDMLANFKRLPWKRILPPMLFFILAIIPLILRKNSVSPGLDFSLNPALRDAEALSTLYTVYYPIGPINYVLLGSLQGLAGIATLLISFRKFPSQPADGVMKNFLIAILIVIAIGSLASYLFPVTFIIQFQLIRIGVFLLYFTYLYLAWIVSRTIATEVRRPLDNWVIVLAYVTFLLPVMALLFWLLRAKPNQKRIAWAGLSILVLVAAAELVLAYRFHFLAPGYHIYGPRTVWRETQEWAKANTPKDALFLTPPYEFWHYEPDWRVFSERGTVATIPEFMVLHLDPAFMPGFLERFDDLAPGARAQFNGDYNHSFALTRQAFDSLSLQDYQRIAAKHGAQYLVLPLSHQIALSPIYTNSGYAIYQLP